MTGGTDIGTDVETVTQCVERWSNCGPPASEGQARVRYPARDSTGLTDACGPRLIKLGWPRGKAEAWS